MEGYMKGLPKADYYGVIGLYRLAIGQGRIAARTRCSERIFPCSDEFIPCSETEQGTSLDGIEMATDFPLLPKPGRKRGIETIGKFGAKNENFARSGNFAAFTSVSDGALPQLRNAR
jgi:hypothetical protein